MLKKRLKNPIFLIYLLVIYVTIQFSWWLYLIFSLYSTIYTGTERLKVKTWMLLGEGSVFFLILILGIIVILRAFKRERQLTRQQENFVLSVTHELKTPIASVKLFLQTLKKRTLPEDKKNEIYDRSLGEINRLGNLVNNILMTRNIENRNYFLDKKRVNITEFIREKTNVLKTSVLKQHHITLDLTEHHVLVDTNAFESILVNILENASKYAPEKSTISIRLDGNENEALIAITDEGPGIDTKQQDKVFSKFYREENEMTRQSKGTGLGLYITKFLVEQHGGTITLDNNKPSGLKVNIVLKK